MKASKTAVIGEIAQILADIFAKCGVPAAECEEKSKAAADAIADRFAGTKVNFPKIRNETRQRDEQLYAAHVFGGLSLAKVAKHAKLSKTAAHYIVQRMKKEFERDAKKVLT